MYLDLNESFDQMYLLSRMYGGIQERGDVELPSNTLFTNTEIAGDRYTHREWR